MSNKRKNFHYHYAEQYETREERIARSRRKSRFSVSPIALVITVVMLMVFGLVSTSFSVYVTTSFDDPNIPQAGGLIVSVRNNAVRSDTDSEGIVRKGDSDLAGTGWDSLDRVFYDNAPTGWSDVYCFVGKNGYVRAYKMTATGNPSVYTVAIGGFTDRSALFFASAANSTMTTGSSSYNITDSKSTLTSGSYTANYNAWDSNDNGKTFYMTSSTNGDTLHRADTKVLVSGSSNGSSQIASASWSTTADVMNYDGSVHYITYSNVAAGSYAVCVTNYNSWTNALRGNSAIGTGTNCTLANNGDSDSNIKITTTANADVTISSNGTKINATAVVTATPFNVNIGTITNGSISSGSATAVENSTVTLTASPNYGYALDTVTVTKSGGGTVTTSGSGNTRTFTMPADDVTVTATFEKDSTMNLYIAGRFHVQTTDSSGVWTNSFDSGNWSNTGDGNIKFVWDSTAQVYKVETHASLKNLSDQISSIEPWFFVYDQGNGKYWYETTSNTYLTTSNTSATLTMYNSQTDSVNARLRFNDQSTDKPVTLYFDPTTGVLSYHVPPFYNITVGSGITGGTVTASPTRTTEGDTVTLTVTPDTGYTINTVSYSYGGNSYNITPVNDVYSFTMPESNVTVTATFNGTPTITSFTIDGNTEATMDIADTATLASAKLHSSGTVTYAVTAQTASDNSGNDVISLVNGTVTALRPGTATITASLTGAESKTVTVTVNEPTLTLSTISVEEYRSAQISVSDASPAPSSYDTWSISGNIATISVGSPRSTATVTSIADYSSGTSATVTLSVTYAGGYTKEATAAVTITESTVKLHQGLTSSGSWDDYKMVYSPSLSTDYGGSIYSVTRTLDGSTNYGFDIRVGSDYYKSNTTITSSNQSTYALAGSGLSLSKSTGTGNDCIISTAAAGTYTFYYDKDNSLLYVGDYPGIEYHMLGFNNTWSSSASTIMTETAPGSGIYSYTRTMTAAQRFTAGTVATGFKVWCNDSNWYGLNNTTFGYDSNDTLTSSATLESNVADSYNLGMNVWYGGDYTFTFNSSTKVLSITSSPSRDVSVTATVNGSDESSATVSLSSLTSDYFTLKDNHNDTFTVTAKNHPMYTFQGWSGTHGSNNPYTFTVASPTAYTIGSIWNYRSYSVTFNTNGGSISGFTPLTGSSPTYTSSYTYGTGLTLPTATQITYSPYYFGGWYESPDFSGSAVTAIANDATGPKTYYAKWNVKVDIKDNISGNSILSQPLEIVLGGSVDINSINIPSYSGFEYSHINGNYQNLTSDRLGNNALYLIYKPIAQPFTVTITPGNDGRVTGSGTAENNYIISFGAKISVHAELTKPANVTSDISYKWLAYRGTTQIDQQYATPTTYDSTTGKYIFERDDIVPLLTQMTSGTYTLKAKAYYTDATGSEVYTDDGDEYSYTIYYKIASPEFEAEASPVQMIYAAGASPDLVFNVTAHSTITQVQDYVDKITTYYKTGIFIYNKLISGADKYEESAQLLGLTQENSSSTFSSTYSNVPDGVNYYKFKLKRLADVNAALASIGNDPELVYDDAAAAGPVRTVVGSSQSSASRPLYIANNSGTSFSGKRVMLFYISNNELKFMTSSSRVHATTTDREVYRFDIPADVENVSLGVFDSEYVLPELGTGASAGQIIYPDGCYYAFSDWVNITQSVQKVNISGGVSQGNMIGSAYISTGDLLS